MTCYDRHRPLYLHFSSIFTSGLDGVICLWSEDCKFRHKFRTTKSWVTACSASKCGKWLTTATREGEVTFWRTSSFTSNTKTKIRKETLGLTGAPPTLLNCRICGTPFSRKSILDYNGTIDDVCRFCRMTEAAKNEQRDASAKQAEKLSHGDRMPGYGSNKVKLDI